MQQDGVRANYLHPNPLALYWDGPEAPRGRPRRAGDRSGTGCGEIIDRGFLRVRDVQHPCERIAGPCWQPGLRWSPGEGGMTVMPKNRAPRICLGIFFAIFVAPALAHDPSHPELNNWFNRLASGRGLCLLVDRRCNRSRPRLGIEGGALSRPSLWRVDRRS